MFNFLFVSTRWFSIDGGIQTINRELCKELSTKNKIYVLLSDEITKNEIADADKYGIKLIDIFDIQGKIKEVDFDFVCTHSTFTGQYIDKIKEFTSNKVKYIHFLHHDPEEIENLKEYIKDKQEIRIKKKEKEIEYAIKADMVIAVGEKLREAYKVDLYNANSALLGKRKYLNFGITEDSRVFAESTKAPQVLLSGRTTSIYVKGIDLFVSATKKAQADSKLQISCVVRGEDGNLDELAELLKDKYNAPSNITIKQFTTNSTELERERKNSTLAVMPSREEGFGLAAAETISLGIPTIVSNKSGIGKLIESLEIEDGIKNRFVWEYGEDDKSIKELSEKIKACLEDQLGSFEATIRLRDKLYEVSSWKGGVKQFIKFCQELLKIEIMEIDNEEISLFMKRKDPYLRLYDRALENASDSIDIMSIKLNKLREKQGNLLINKSKNFRVRIALLDPCFPIPDENNSVASIREKEEEMSAGDIRKEIASWYNDIWLKKGDESKLEIRLFTALPTVNIITADDTMFTGSFLLNTDGMSPTFIVEKNKKASMGHQIFDAYMSHFEILWENARSFDDIPEQEIKQWELGKIL